MNPIASTGQLRRVLHLLLRGHGNAHRSPRDLARLHLAWIRTASRIVQAESDQDVRELLSRFFTENMGAAETRYVPSALSSGALRLTRSGQTVEVTLASGESWTPDEMELVRQALDTADAVLHGHAKLAEVHSQSLTDPLTGLHNRRSLTQHLAREVLLSRRHGAPLSIAAIDVDHFKEINDALGHAAGDDVLRRIAGALTSILRRTDLIFRHGGDEFIVLLPQTTAAQATLAMEKVVGAMSEPTISVGIAQLDHRDTPQSLLHSADDALYAAKRAQRNCIRSADRAAA